MKFSVVATSALLAAIAPFADAETGTAAIPTAR
jgi:hypothetical protein